jgi:hypothetical protein
MVHELEAVFGNGLLCPLEPLSLVEKQRVHATITDIPPLERINHRYAEQEWLAALPMPVVLRSGVEAVKVLAYLDTGASDCLFERKHGNLLDLEIEAGDSSDLSDRGWRG